MKKILYSFMLLLSTSYCFASVSVTYYGAVPDDGKDDTVAINDALNNTDNNLSITFPDGEYEISDTISVNKPGIIFQSLNHHKARIKSNNGSLIVLHSFSKMHKFVLDNVKLIVHGSSAANASDRFIRWNKFINTPDNEHCITFDPYLGTPSDILLYQNTFYDCHSAVTGYLRDVFIESNHSINLKRHYLLAAAKRVSLTGNTMDGGIVGIGFLTRASQGAIVDNTISNNLIRDPSEEGISFDMIGNSSDSYSRWNGIVNGYESFGGFVTKLVLQDSGEGIDPSQLVGHQLVFLENGAGIGLKGKVVHINEVQLSNNIYSLVVDSGVLPVSAMGPGAYGLAPDARAVALSYLVKGNVVESNIILRAGRTGIGLHGVGINTAVSQNEIYGCNTEGGANTAIWGGIVLRNINYAGATLGKHGPVFFNTIEGNHFQGVNCDLKAFNLNYGMLPDLFNVIGNTKAANTFIGGATYIWQDQD